MEIEESARIDGCSQIGIVFKITFPLSAPAIASVAILNSLLAWNEFLFALNLTLNKSVHTAPIAIANLIEASYIDWGGLAAGGIILIIPIILFASFAQKYLVSGLTAGIGKI